MKKFLLWLLTLTITFPALARDFQYTDKNYRTITYTVIDEILHTCSVKRTVGSPYGRLEIPATVSDGTNNYSVTSIGDEAFNCCSGLTSVSIPNSVTSIGKWAFNWCSSLTSVAIPNSVTSIGRSAFELCSSLTSVTIPNSVTSIGDYAFKGCSSLTSVTISNSVTSIGDAAFYGCSGLTSLIIPSSVTWIGAGAFSGCSGLTSVTIPNSVTSIRGTTFYNCSGLTSVTIPNSVTSIGSSAFAYCSGLTSVTIPNSVTLIGESTFYKCSGLTSVTIPNSVISIGNYAFERCEKLEEINSNMLEPEKCKAESIFATYYGSSPAFNYAAATLAVPEGTAAKYRATAPWSNFTNIVERPSEGLLARDFEYTYKGQTITYTVVDENLRTCSVRRSSDAQSGILEIPSTVSDGTSIFSVTSIKSAAFYGCGSLSSVFIPNSVTSIGESAFDGCSGLTSVIIPNFVTSIGYNAFYNCSSLVKSAYPKTLTNPFQFGKAVVYEPEGAIVEDGFVFGPEKSSILFVPYMLDGEYTIPNSVTSIGNRAFSGCSNLTSVTIPNSVTSIGEGAFYSCAILTSVTIPNSVASIGSSAFDGCSRLTSLSIPNSVTSIEDRTFYGCSGLTTVSIPNSVTSIGNSAFYRCSGLTSVNIPNSVTSIGNDAFTVCSSLTSLTIPNSVTSIGNDAFSACSGLASLTIPNSVIWIGAGAFSGCSGLTSVTIPHSVTSIGNSAFLSCYGLTSVIIPNSVTSIGDYAFMRCSGLTSVTIPSSITSIGKCAFTGCEKLTDINSEILNPESCDAVDMFATYYGATFNFSAATLTVPEGTAAKYRATAPWSNFTNIVERAPEGPVASFGMADATLRMGQEVTVPVSMSNSVDITSFQCDIHLPAGFEVVTDAQGAPVVALSDRKSATHAIQSAVMTDGVVRVTCFSANNAPFSGSEGELFTVKLQPVSAAVGVHELTIDNIVAAKPDAKGVNIEPARCSITLQKALMPGDVTNDDVVNVSDAIATINYILGKTPETYLLENADVNGDEVINILDVTEIIQIVLGTNQSQSQAPGQNEPETTDAEALYIEDFEIYNGFPGWMPVKLRASQNYTGFQTDISLPEGLEVLTRTEGGRTYPDVQLHDACNSGSHLVSAAMQPDGALRVISLSMANAMYGQSADNTLFMVRVRVKPDFTTPVLSPVQFRNTLFNTGTAESHFAPSQSIIDINDFLAGVENVTDGTAPAQYFNLQGMPVHNPQKGMICIRKTAASAEKVVY